MALGDGSTTFNLPDLRGRFLRGSDVIGGAAADRDPDFAHRVGGNDESGWRIGSSQEDRYLNHDHSAQGSHIEPRPVRSRRRK